MSKTGDYLIGKIEDIEKSTGYPFDFLQARHETILQEFSRGEHGTEHPLEILAQRAEAKAWGDPETAKEIQTIAQNTGYEFDFLLAMYNEEIEEGTSPKDALTDVRVISEEQDW